MNLLKRTVCFGVALSALIGISSMNVAAQEKAARSEKKRGEFCQSWNSNYGDNVSFNEVREMTLPAGDLAVNGEKNGGVHVIGSDRNDILVRACVQVWAKSDAAVKVAAQNIRIEKSPVLRAVNASGESNWGVSYEILVPRQTDLNLTTYNGGVSVDSVSGKIEFTAKNGGIHLTNVSGEVTGKTQNGGVHVTLNGNSWSGNGLDVETKNGGVHLTMPENYAARIETGTVNGGFSTDFAALKVERGERWKPVKISADLNGGGATVRVVTTNGGVKIKSADKTEQ